MVIFMKSTKKEIVLSIIFCTGLVVLLMVSSWFFRPKRNTEAYGMEDMRANGILTEPENTIDVLFLGDSVSYCSIMPLHIWSEYGITSYVCATSQQELYYTKEFLKKAFATQSPKIVFLGTSVLFQEFEHKENARMMIEKAFPVFRYHDRWKEAGKMPEFASGMKVDYVHQIRDKGYYFSLASEAIDVGDYTAETESIEWIPDICRESLWQIKDFCEKNNAELILLSEPNAAGAWAPYRHNAVDILAWELEIPYIDLNYMQEEVPIDWSKDSFDAGDHLNYYGAKKVSSYLGKYLNELGTFEDKRKDTQYQSWNQFQESFYEMEIKEKM